MLVLSHAHHGIATVGTGLLRRGRPRCSFQAIGAARGRLPRTPTRVSPRMDRNSELVAAAFHQCRSGTASHRAPAGACPSSRLSLKTARAIARFVDGGLV